MVADLKPTHRRLKVTAERLGFSRQQPLESPSPLRSIPCGAPAHRYCVVASGQILAESVLEIPRASAAWLTSIPHYARAGVVYRAYSIRNSAMGDHETASPRCNIDETHGHRGIILHRAQLIIAETPSASLATTAWQNLGPIYCGDGRVVTDGKAPRAKHGSEPRATVRKKITKDDGRIDWHAPAIEIERQVRAYQSVPGTHTRLGDFNREGVEGRSPWKGVPVTPVELLPDFIGRPPHPGGVRSQELQPANSSAFRITRFCEAMNQKWDPFGLISAGASSKRQEDRTMKIRWTILAWWRMGASDLRFPGFGDYVYSSGTDARDIGYFRGPLASYGIGCIPLRTDCVGTLPMWTIPGVHILTDRGMDGCWLVLGER